MKLAPAIAALSLCACGGDSYLVVTVDARPAVQGAAKLEVSLTNSGTTLTHELALGAHAFPVKFSIDAPGRSGELDLAVDAIDGSGLTVGHGAGTATIGSGAATLTLDTTDFTVNTDYAMDQFLAFDYDADGLQVAATSDGTWTVGFRDNCNGSGMCNVFGRRFDAKGVAQTTVAAAGTNAFTLTTTLTDAFTDPVIATNGATTLALWNYTDSVGSGHGVACRPISATGDAGAGQLSLSTDSASIISTAPLSNGNVAVTWELGFGIPPNASIRTIVAKPDCSTVTPSATTVSQSEGTSSGPESPTVASNNGNTLYAWIVDGEVFVRIGNNAAQFTGNETKLIAKTATQSAGTLRAVAMGSGFGLVVRWVHPTMNTAPGKIELFQITSAGALSGAPTLITDQSRSDFTSGLQAPSIAARADGTMLVAWHVCDAGGTQGSCDVFGRLLAADGSATGTAFVLTSTTTGDQTTPAVAALPGPDGAFVVVFTDTSHAPPDTSGEAVHARIVYPATSGSGG